MSSGRIRVQVSAVTGPDWQTNNPFAVRLLSNRATRKTGMGIADRRQREKEQRKTGITDAAERLFFSRGYEDVSMEDIARDVELTRLPYTCILKIRRPFSRLSCSVASGSSGKNSRNVSIVRFNDRYFLCACSIVIRSSIWISILSQDHGVCDRVFPADVHSP